MGGKVGVDVRGSEEIQGEEGLRQETVPEMEGKVGVCTAESGNEMILEGADGAFGRVASMDMGGASW